MLQMVITVTTAICQDKILIVCKAVDRRLLDRPFIVMNVIIGRTRTFLHQISRSVLMEIYNYVTPSLRIAQQRVVEEHASFCM